MTIERILKYELPLVDWATIEMPFDAEPLCVQVQNGVPMLWARTDGAMPGLVYRFRIAGTGHVLGPKVGRYLSTFQLNGGALVFHVFAEGETA